ARVRSCATVASPCSPLACHPSLPAFPTRRSSDLYSGTTGIALFLARLHHMRPDPLLAQTARGAIRQALSKADDIPPTMRNVVGRSEEHTSELQSHLNLVCRLLLEKNNANTPVCTK